MVSEKILLNLFLVLFFVLEPKFSFPVGDDDGGDVGGIGIDDLNEVDSVFNETKLLELDLFEDENNGETPFC